jgi:hypothetical protein
LNTRAHQCRGPAIAVAPRQARLAGCGRCPLSPLS